MTHYMARVIDDQRLELPRGALGRARPGQDIGVDLEDLTAIKDPVESPFVNEAQAAEFHNLAEQWRRETGVLSDTELMAMNPCYQRIIGMGRDAIPLILNEMIDQPDHWFWALRAITGDDPVLPEHAGKVSDMCADWITWGRQRYYI